MAPILADLKDLGVNSVRETVQHGFEVVSVADQREGHRPIRPEFERRNDDYGLARQGRFEASLTVA